MKKIPKIWQTLKVLRDNPDGVNSRFLVQNHIGLYHKFASRCSDLRNLFRYDISEAELVEDWVYRWKLKDHSYMHPEERKVFPLPSAHFDNSGQGNMSLGV
jgi:hypothetical protein